MNEGSTESSAAVSRFSLDAGPRTLPHSEWKPHERKQCLSVNHFEGCSRDDEKVTHFSAVSSSLGVASHGFPSCRRREWTLPVKFDSCRSLPPKSKCASVRAPDDCRICPTRSDDRSLPAHSVCFLSICPLFIPTLVRERLSFFLLCYSPVPFSHRKKKLLSTLHPKKRNAQTQCAGFARKNS